MHPFRYQKLQLASSGVTMERLAQRYGTPLYVYNLDAIAERYQDYQRAFPDALLCAAVKANGNLGVLRRLARLGSGFDVVSGGELERALRAGAPGERIVFSGVGKTAEEMDRALAAGILLFNVESEPELELLAERAARARRVARYG
ncbi:MAG: diaminopimelate decarboxylase family protein, partial [Terriglobales bacterium]